MKSFGKALREARAKVRRVMVTAVRQKFITVKDAARHCHVTTQAVYGWLRMHRQSKKLTNEAVMRECIKRGLLPRPARRWRHRLKKLVRSLGLGVGRAIVQITKAAPDAKITPVLSVPPGPPVNGAPLATPLGCDLFRLDFKVPKPPEPVDLEEDGGREGAVEELRNTLSTAQSLVDRLAGGD